MDSRRKAYVTSLTTIGRFHNSVPRTRTPRGKFKNLISAWKLRNTASCWRISLGPRNLPILEIMLQNTRFSAKSKSSVDLICHLQREIKSLYDYNTWFFPQEAFLIVIPKKTGAYTHTRWQISVDKSQLTNPSWQKIILCALDAPPSELQLTKSMKLKFVVDWDPVDKKYEI